MVLKCVNGILMIMTEIFMREIILFCKSAHLIHYPSDISQIKDLPEAALCFCLPWSLNWQPDWELVLKWYQDLISSLMEKYFNMWKE